MVGISLLGWSAVAWGQTCSTSSQPDWRTRARQTCEAIGVPGTLAQAVLQHESNGHLYALRINAGHGYSLYPSTWDEAVRILQALAPLTTNLDLGLMQINLRFWGSRLGMTAIQLLEPEMNVTVGCHILRRALDRGGPAWQRIGRYHSSNPARQRRYAFQVARQMEALFSTK